jgi:outer membrane protein
MRKAIVAILFGVFFFSAANAQKKWTLQECIEYAYEQNLDIVQAQLMIQQAENNLFQSKANMAPTLNGSAGYNFNIGRSIDPFTNEFVDQTIGSNNFSLSSGVTIFNGFRIQNGIKMAKSDVESAKQSEAITKNNIALAVALAYLQIIQNEEQLSAARKQLEASQDQLSRNDKLEQAGSVNALVGLNLKAQVANDKLQVVNTENIIRNAYVNLINLIQLEEGDLRVEAISNIGSPQMNLETVEDIYNVAITTLPEVAQAKYQNQSALYGLKTAKAARYPSISGFGNLNTVYSESSKEFEITGFTTSAIGLVEGSNEVVLGASPTYTTSVTPYGDQITNNLGRSFGVGVSIPILNQLQAKTAVSNAKLNVQMSLLQEDRVLNQIKNDIAQAYSALTAAYSTYLASEENTKAQKTNYEFSKKRFDAGLLNGTDLLTAKNNWASAEASLIQSKYEFLFRKLIIQFYKGETIAIK